jgi:hypothetical protein
MSITLKRVYYITTKITKYSDLARVLQVAPGSPVLDLRDKFVISRVSKGDARCLGCCWPR